MVHKHLNYGDLLRDIRTDKVQRLSFFSQPETVDLEGPCLVTYKDGTVAQSYVPDFDFRVPYAARSHSVATVRLPPEPIPDTFSAKQIWTENQAKLVYRIVPLIAIGIVYAATQLAAKLKVLCVLSKPRMHFTYARILTLTNGLLWHTVAHDAACNPTFDTGTPARQCMQHIVAVPGMFRDG